MQPIACADVLYHTVVIGTWELSQEDADILASTIAVSNKVLKI